MKREPGFYRVRETEFGPWTIAHYDGAGWYFVGRIGHHQVAEVDERRIPDHE